MGETSLQRNARTYFCLTWSLFFFISSFLVNARFQFWSCFKEHLLRKIIILFFFSWKDRKDINWQSSSSQSLEVKSNHSRPGWAKFISRRCPFKTCQDGLISLWRVLQMVPLARLADKLFFDMSNALFWSALTESLDIYWFQTTFKRSNVRPSWLFSTQRERSTFNLGEGKFFLPFYVINSWETLIESELHPLKISAERSWAFHNGGREASYRIQPFLGDGCPDMN